VKVLVLGAGEVGFHIALRLSREGNDVVVVDQDAERLKRVEELMDVSTVCGRASVPSVLKRAGAEDADLLIAATTNDEVNMLACQVAHSLFRVPMKLARVREAEYDDPRLIGRDDLPIDRIIAPEKEAAEAIVRRVRISAAADVQVFADGKVLILGVPVVPKGVLAGVRLDELDEVLGGIAARVVACEHNRRWRVPTSETVLLAGDSVYLSVAASDADALLRRLGRGEEAGRRRDVFIVGGGRIGYHTAMRLAQLGHAVKLIERDRARAEWLAENLPEDVIVVCGDAINPQQLEEENVRAATDFLALTNDDETNILASLIAKRYGIRHVVTLINRTLYNEMARDMGLDVTICPRMTTVASILRHVRRGRIFGVAPLGDGSLEVIEAEALETTELVGKPLRELALPEQCAIAAIVRGEDVIVPSGEDRIQPGDHVVVVARSERAREVERLFEVKIEFF